MSTGASSSDGRELGNPGNATRADAAAGHTDRPWILATGPFYPTQVLDAGQPNHQIPVGGIEGPFARDRLQRRTQRTGSTISARVDMQHGRSCTIAAYLHSNRHPHSSATVYKGCKCPKHQEIRNWPMRDAEPKIAMHENMRVLR